MKLPLERVLKVLDPGGPISLGLKSFESRQEQKNMLADILQAYNENKVALIEAGTGCGKSMAYLIPALLFAALHKERTVISTNTINLQEQLLLKDIPLLIKALKLTLKVVLVKGMGNYLCLRKLQEAVDEKKYYSPEEQKEIENIHDEAPKLKEGSRSELPFAPSQIVWERVNGEHDTCHGNECPHFNECFFYQARKEAADAHILVVNHHLLFADLHMRSESEERTLLPHYTRLIIDEAHNIEEIATEYFAAKVNRLSMLKTLSRLSTEKHNGTAHGKLHLLREKIHNHFSKNFSQEAINLDTRLVIDLPGQKREILLHIAEAFYNLEYFLKENGGLEEELKMRLQKELYENEAWKTSVLPQVQKLIQSLISFDTSLKNIDQDIKALDIEKLTDMTKGLRHEIIGLSSRLEASAQTLVKMVESDIPHKRVRWIESNYSKKTPNTFFVDADLDLAPKLSQQLFNKFSTVVLVSATLASGKSFHFVRERLGISGIAKEVIEKIYTSPFNYKAQAIFVIPNDLPPPAEGGFLDKAADVILQALEASLGGAFLLFTSYTMLRNCYTLLEEKLRMRKYPLFKQGTKSRQALLDAFKAEKRGILFGTDSFWEGVDVAGDALRLVIIVKLPFKVPSEPIIEARMEALAKEGKDPFSEYNLPQAIVKFKQGFGRLIRHKNDRGAILCLDSRLLTKGYGKQFLNSLPLSTPIAVPSSQIKEQLSCFYKKTFALTLR